jgi:DNA-binding NtrC family response regulator
MRTGLKSSPRPRRGLSWFDQMMERIGMQIILEAVGECDGNRTHAARILGLNRSTVIRRMAAYNNALLLRCPE